jgi:hypothetical protein
LATLAILGLFLCGSSTARATIVTYYFSGTVNAITDPGNGYVPSGIQNGSTFVGTFSYDNSATAYYSDSNNAYYRGTALNIAASVTIAGQYVYTLGPPQSNDEIDLIGSLFEFFGRGPTVTEGFYPNPPFSFFQFLGTTTSDVLANAQVVNTTSSAGVSDAGSGDPNYYFIGASLPSVAQVPEPSSLFLVGIGAGGLLMRILKRHRPADQPVLPKMIERLHDPLPFRHV